MSLKGATLKMFCLTEGRFRGIPDVPPRVLMVILQSFVGIHFLFDNSVASYLILATNFAFLKHTHTSLVLIYLHARARIVLL